MVILSATDLASKPRSGHARSDHTTSQIPWTARSAGVLFETFIDVLPMPNDCCHRRKARTEQIQLEAKINACRTSHRMKTSSANK
jgi:hypothetical protein